MTEVKHIWPHGIVKGRLIEKDNPSGEEQLNQVLGDLVGKGLGDSTVVLDIGDVVVVVATGQPKEFEQERVSRVWPEICETLSLSGLKRRNGP